MVKNWRQAWGQGNFPVLFVQLPRIVKRSRWPEFRAAQEACLAIPNTAMAVTIDQGHPTDVHPKEKEVVGRRLAHQALHKYYNYQNLLSASPTLSSYEWLPEQRTFYLGFSNAGTGLKYSEGKKTIGFSLQAYSKDGTKELILIPESIQIEGDTIKIIYPKECWITTLKYAWAPFPENNIVNSTGLPMAPFKIELSGLD